jgi:hypothetical protein
VGLSLGFPGTNTSFCAQFKTLSKLIIIAMMLRGRHRGLPYALDRAVLLPGEGLKKDKVRELEARMLDNERRASEASGVNRRLDGANLQDRRTTAHERRDSNVTTDDHGRPRRLSLTRQAKLARLMAGALSAGPVAKQKRG